jgi:putative transposase
MPRAARIVVCGVPYHITQRGNNRQEVFLDEQDYLTYLRLLAHYARARGLEILGYCLMSNHVHLIAVPTLETSLAQAVGHANLRYAQIANERYERSGHLWQSRYYACPLDRAHLVAAMRYVERNPVRAGLAEEPWEYPWSSAAAHVGGTDQYALLAFDGWRREWSPAAWRDFIAGPDDDWQLERIRLQTRTGRPLGSDGFVRELEQRLGRRLRPCRAGRRRKDETSRGERATQG